jgi:hypothetical protein
MAMKGPIQEEYRAQMNAVARMLDEVFNGSTRGADRKVGFVLLVFPFGEGKDGRCNYISNGADRVDIIRLLREQANRFDTETLRDATKGIGEHRKR